MNFYEFGFEDQLLDGLDAMGYEKPTPIQEQAIPAILNGKDIIACAQTGTGKTAAFVLPVLNELYRYDTRQLRALIIVPTRELAQQIDKGVEGFAYFMGIQSMAVYGGGDGFSWDQQQKALREGTDIIVATPGRLLAMLTQAGSVDTKHIEFLILDEADRMLDMGFYEDIMRIVAYLPKNRQTLMFSATMPDKIRKMAQQILHEPIQINLQLSKPAEGILQEAYVVHEEQKTALLREILRAYPTEQVIIFCSTKDKVKSLNQAFSRERLSYKAFHSDLEQSEREVIMQAFKNRQLQILIGTDILSRGIDVDGIALVVNVDVPGDAEDYIHRVGRTARAERTGKAITFINPKDMRKFHMIEKLIEKEIPKLPLPNGFEPGPAYDPNHRAPSTGRKPGKNFRRKSS